MTTTSTAVPHQPVHTWSRFAFVLALLGNTIRISSGSERTSPFDVVLWTAVGVVVLYGGTLLVAALAHRPLRPRTWMRLEASGLLAMAVVASWSVVAAARSGQWEELTASALAAAVFGALLWLMARQLRALPADVTQE